MTTLEIIKKELPECIWRRFPAQFNHEIDPALYGVHDLFDVFMWNATPEGFAFWDDLYTLYVFSCTMPTSEEVKEIFDRHGIPLEVPSGEA